MGAPIRTWCDIYRTRGMVVYTDRHEPVTDRSPEGLPLPSNVNGKDNRENRASDDGKDVLERIGRVETNHNESDTPNDVSAEQHDGERCRPLLHGQDEQPSYDVESADSGGRVREDGDSGGGDTEEVMRKARHHLC